MGDEWKCDQLAMNGDTQHHIVVVVIKNILKCLTDVGMTYDNEEHMVYIRILNIPFPLKVYLMYWFQIVDILISDSYREKAPLAHIQNFV